MNFRSVLIVIFLALLFVSCSTRSVLGTYSCCVTRNMTYSSKTDVKVIEVKKDSLIKILYYSVNKPCHNYLDCLDSASLKRIVIGKWYRDKNAVFVNFKSDTAKREVWKVISANKICHKDELFGKICFISSIRKKHNIKSKCYVY